MKTAIAFSYWYEWQDIDACLTQCYKTGDLNACTFSLVPSFINECAVPFYLLLHPKESTTATVTVWASGVLKRHSVNDNNDFSLSTIS